VRCLSISGVQAPNSATQEGEPVSTTKSSAGVRSIASLAFWSQSASERGRTFAELRRQAPVSFQEPLESGVTGTSPGFWAVTRHADVVSVSRNSELFCSSQGVGMNDTPVDLESKASFLVMDPPRQTAMRRVVNGAFTPKRVTQLQDRIGAEATRIVDEFVDGGRGDVVEDFSRKLPLWTICEILGVPESMRLALSTATELLIHAQDAGFSGRAKDGGMGALKAGAAIHRMARALIADRRAHPGDDILSALVHSELDGEPASDQILRNIILLFITAGNETTRHTTSNAFRLFADHPDQWSLLANDPSLVGSAVEELVRCATPVIHFRRTATADTVLGGVVIAKGDHVVMFYESANRDEAVFDDPETFDITRNPNPHVGFGGGGPHFCLGANLARAELCALFTRLAERVATIRAGEPRYLMSSGINGIERMPVELRPSGSLF
jgi:cytochrome P450